jgi:hypothetical protein
MKNNSKLNTQTGKAEGLLFLVSGDALSQAVRRVAKGAGFKLTIVTLAPDEARLQRGPLPMLLINGYSYGPASLYQFLKSECAG